MANEHTYGELLNEAQHLLDQSRDIIEKLEDGDLTIGQSIDDWKSWLTEHQRSVKRNNVAQA